MLKICQDIGLSEVQSVLKGTMYICSTREEGMMLYEGYHDKMTEMLYEDFCVQNAAEPVQHVDLPEFLRVDNEQTNSEHSRHFFFSQSVCLDGRRVPSLFDLVKEPYNILQSSESHDDNSVVAFCDNSSAIHGFKTTIPMVKNNVYTLLPNKLYHFTCTAETHNFPTGVCPFPGAATGIGGRIRDGQCTGRGSLPVAGSAGYCVGDIFQYDNTQYPRNMAKPQQILLSASDGASDYGNKFGEPIIMGFARSFRQDIHKKRREWIKPIMFTGGIGLMDSLHTNKAAASPGMKICKIGGPAYPVGLGGSHASSRIADSSNEEYDFNAVQRADPEMEQRMNRVVRQCIELEENTPILSIHDQGAGGNANVLKEIIEDQGAIINLSNITLGDPRMTALEIWLAEYQESNAVLTHDVDALRKLCRRENVQLDVIGEVTGTGRLTITYGNECILQEHDYLSATTLGPEERERTQIEENEEEASGSQEDDTECCVLHLTSASNMQQTISAPVQQSSTAAQFQGPSMIDVLSSVFSRVSVGSKRFLTNKVDRSVTGLIAQQQCLGPKHTPLSNLGLIASSHFPNSEGVFSGCVSAIGEQPLVGLTSEAYSPEAMAEKTFAEALLNIVWAYIGPLSQIKMSVNWMWPSPTTDSEEARNMYKTMQRLNWLMKTFQVVADGGKDSLSMVAKHGDELVKSPGSLVLTMYAPCPNVTVKVTPLLELGPQADKQLYFIDLSNGHCSMGGSSSVKNSFSLPPPRLHSSEQLMGLYEVLQESIRAGDVVAGHDKSDGGLVTALLEMCFCSNVGLHIAVNVPDNDAFQYLFNEEIGVVVQLAQGKLRVVQDRLRKHNLSLDPVATILPTQNQVWIRNSRSNTMLLQDSMTNLREKWERTSYRMELMQCGKPQVRAEKTYLSSFTRPHYQVLPRHYNLCQPLSLQHDVPISARPYTVGIMRAQGSNGDRELGAAFLHAGFRVVDVNTQDLADGTVNFDEFHGLAFCGGFSYSDVLGSATAWASVLNRFKPQLDKFYARPDTFSIGVCNGCQLLARLGWIDATLEENASRRFESRFCTLRVEQSDNIFLKNLDGLSLGMWSAHGEGKFVTEADASLIGMTYVDDDNQSTEVYPCNPNGSSRGVAALSSANNRHLGIMPHPERSFLQWQQPSAYYEATTSGPNSGGTTIATQIPPWNSSSMYTPWFSLFTNAFHWVSSHATKTCGYTGETLGLTAAV